jgi:two-component system sensor kinase
LIQAKGLKVLFHDHRPGQAAQIFQEAIQGAKRAGIHNTYIMPNYAWRATALRLEAEQPHDPSQRQVLCRQARAAARLSLRKARRFQNDLPHALRENAILAARQGRRRRARRLFEQSIAVAGRQHALNQIAVTKQAMQQCGLTPS